MENLKNYTSFGGMEDILRNGLIKITLEGGPNTNANIFTIQRL